MERMAGVSARSGSGGRGGRGVSRGPLGWLRRHWLPWASRGLALAGLGVLGCFVVGRVMTDRALWTQYLWWVPVLWTGLAAWGCWLGAAAAGRLALRPGGVMLRPLLLAGCVGWTVWVAVAVWHLPRAVLGTGAAPRERTLRLVHWNLASREEIRDAGAFVRSLDADIAVVVNSRNGEPRREIVLSMLASMAPESEGTVRVLPGIEDQRAAGHVYGDWRVILGSRGRILRAGVVPLSPVEGQNESWPTGWDTGAVAWFEIDLSERFGGLGRPFVLWVVDLPSDPSLWRMQVMRSAAGAVAAWRQPALETTPGGWWRAVGEPVGVPRPDVVMGDFNTVRGSASLEVLAPGMRDAFEEAGWGRGASWRQARSVGPGSSWKERTAARVTRTLLPLADWHIDLTLVGEAWRAGRYRLVDPGAGPHGVQVADLVLRE